MTGLTVVVVAYGDEEMLRRCLAPLVEQLRVVVVDNGRTERCRQVCRELAVPYLDPGANLGFAGGVNVGCDAAGPDDVLLLNPDAALDVETIRSLHRELYRGPAPRAAVAPRQEHPDSGQAQQVSWPFPSPGRQWLTAIGLGRWPSRQGFVIGSALLVSRAALIDVGPFDEGYFLYCEETDWQRRAVERGWAVSEIEECRGFHVGAATSSDSLVREAYFHAAHERYVRKWFGRRGWATYRAACLAGDGARWLSGGSRRAPAAQRLDIYWRGPRRHRDRLLSRT